MDDVVLCAVERAIGTMRENLGERLTVDDMARSAMFSKFHFSRVFQRVTGVSPGRFLSAIRLDEAKRLLLSTSSTVADISHRVGYNSVGTFSTRFHSSVGVSPIGYRQFGGVMPGIPTNGRHMAGTGSTAVRGHVRGPSAAVLGSVFVGLFPGRISEGPPVRYAVLREPGHYLLQDVPAGDWHLVAHSVASGAESDADQVPYVGHVGPITAQPDVAARLAEVWLRPMQSPDPPVLLALPDLRPAARQAIAV